MGTPAEDYARNAMPVVSREEFAAAITEIRTLKEQVAALRALSNPKNVGVNAIIGAATPVGDDLAIARRNSHGISYFNTPHTRAYRTTVQAVGTGGWAAVQFDAVRGNRGAMWVTGANTRITLPAWMGPHWCNITGNLSWDTNGVGDRYIAIRLNGVNFIARDKRAAGAYGEMNCATGYVMTGGDYVELCGYQSSGGNLNIVNFDRYSNELTLQVTTVDT